MAYTEFYADIATGNNVNAGDNKTLTTSTNGDWGNAVANRFTAASGTPFSAVSVGDFASVYLDGATVAVYIARVTAVNGGGASLDLSTTAIAGTAPSNGATGRSCTVGGKWKGPNAAVGFPFGLSGTSLASLKNTNGDVPRVNSLAGTYSITTGITCAMAGPIVWSGYKTVVGDGLGNASDVTFKQTIDGGSSNITLITITGTDMRFDDMIAQNNATGTGAAWSISGSRNAVSRCVGAGVRGAGFTVGAATHTPLLVECEAYDCNKANTANVGGFTVTGAGIILDCERCVSHDNAGSNNCGWVTQNSANRGFRLVQCVADSNGLHGVFMSSSQAVCRLENCDLYNNGTDGVRITGGAVGGTIHIENSNFVKNGGWGINKTDSNQCNATVQNCGFGAGTQANSSGQVTGIDTTGDVAGSITYDADVTPWNAPTTGDFRITLTAAKNTGRGAFCETQASYTGMVAFPDVGAGQHQDAGGGGGTGISLARMALGL